MFLWEEMGKEFFEDDIRRLEDPKKDAIGKFGEKNFEVGH